MPSENKLNCSTTQVCNKQTTNVSVSNTDTSGQLLTSPLSNIPKWSTSNTAVGMVNGQLTTSTSTGLYGVTNFSENIVYGTSSISNSNITYNDTYRYPKDGEVRIDPETGDSSIYFADYNKWVDCDIMELKKTKDEKGNKKIILSVSYEMSVAQIKQKQQERKVLVEKVQKCKSLEFFTSGYINTIGGTGGDITLPYIITPYIITQTTTTNPYINIGTDPYSFNNININSGTFYTTNDITNTTGTYQTTINSI